MKDAHEIMNNLEDISDFVFEILFDDQDNEAAKALLIKIEKLVRLIEVGAWNTELYNQIKTDAKALLES